jgi:hypothetical protein
MRILLADTVLADPAQWPDLEALLDQARRNRCYVDTLNPAAVLDNPWFNQANRQRQQHWLNATDWATKDAALFRLRTLIADLQPNPTASPARITLPDAIDLVGRTASLWLENGRNDRQFFLAMMPAEQRAMFLEWETRRIIRSENGGGLGELRMALEEIDNRGALDPRADRALFDSDAEVPGHSSRNATLMIAFCQRKQIAYHCLSRRAIENYLPGRALWAWANGGSDRRARKQRSAKVAAYWRMSDPQRRHFHLKSGWDARPSAQVTSLYESVSHPDRAALQNGIDGGIASLYGTYMECIHDWSSMEGVDLGLQAAISEITDWIRVPYA